MAVTEEETSNSVNRVQPKSQIEKELDDLRGKLNSDGVAKKLQTVPATWVDTTNRGSVDFHCLGSSAANNVYAKVELNVSGFSLSGAGGSLTLGGNSINLSSGGAKIYAGSYIQIGSTNNNEFKITGGGIGVVDGELSIYGETEYSSYALRGRVDFNTDGFVISGGGVTLEATSDGLFINGKKVLTEE